MESGKIYAQIIAAMKDIEAIGKGKYNKQQGFSFRGIDDVMNALHPVLTKHDIFTVTEVLEQTREHRTTERGSQLNYSLLKFRTRFYTTDGSYVDAVTMGEGMDSGDKASNKAMSIAYKYALFQVFCIPTEEMKDPDAETPPPSKQNDSASPATTATSKQNDNSASVTAAPTPEAPIICAACGRPISPTKTQTVQQVAQATAARYGQATCVQCAKALERELAKEATT